MALELPHVPGQAPDDDAPADRARPGNGARRPWVDNRVRSAPAPRAAPKQLPRILDGNVRQWIDVEPTPIAFTIAEFVPRSMTTLLVGHGGAGKSILSQTALTVTAVGMDFYGRPVQAGTTAAVFAEDPAAVIHARQVKINAALGVNMTELADRLYPQSFAGVDACLWRGGTTTPFFDGLEVQLRAIQGLSLVALDNVALLYADNENDRIAVSGFLNALNGMAARLNCGMILSTHTSKSTDGLENRIASGSTAWLNACRSVLTLRADDDDKECVQLRLAKANHTRPGETIDLIWRDGILMPQWQREDGVFGTIRRLSCERVFLALLARANRQDRRVTDQANAPNYAPRVFHAVDDNEGYKSHDFVHAMETLFARDAIALQTTGPASKQRRFLVVCGPEEGQE